MAPGEYDSRRGGRQPSPLAEAFQNACGMVVQQTVRAEAEKEGSPLRQQLEAFTHAVIRGLLDDGLLGNRVAGAVAEEVEKTFRWADLRPKEAGE